MLAILPMLLPLIQSIVGRVIPDAGKQAEVTAELQRALIERQAEIDKAVAEAARAQAEINLKEAESPSILVAGWRPAVGWCCVVGFAYATTFQPVLAWVAHAAGVMAPPVADTSVLMTTLGGMLGLGTLRTVEKVKDVARETSPTKGRVK